MLVTDETVELSELLVGRIGAEAVAVPVLVVTRAQVDEAHARSAGQHPPPRLAGQD